MNSLRVVDKILWTTVVGTITAAVLGSSHKSPLQHFYYVNDASALQSLEQNGDQIDLVSPLWFSVNRAGKLESTLDVRVVEWAAANNVALMPVLVNKGFDAETAHQFLSDPQLTEDLIVTLLKIAAFRRFTGIQLDFENIPAGDRDAYTAFARSLSHALHNLRMQMSVAVMSPTGAKQQANGGGWEMSSHSQAFNYFELGAEADLISLMAYDQHTAPDDPGPIAGLPWVEACIQKVLQYVPSRKLLLGIPLYYRKWAKDAGVAEGPFSVAQTLAERWSASIDLDPVQAESTFRFNDTKAEQIVWLYDARALSKRLELVNKYHLRGFSAWRLGQEDPLTWRRVFPTAVAKKGE
jgi:spore germination protein YaaH